MDWTALSLSLQLAAWTVAILLPVSIVMGRFLAYRQFRGKGLVEALVMLPLVLPPTVFGFYLLVAFGRNSPVGDLWQSLFGSQLVFTFEGLVLASVIFNLPFAIQPAQRGFEAIPVEVREASAFPGLVVESRASAGLAGCDDGNGPDLRPYAWRVRYRADGGRLYPRRDQDHRHRHL